MRVVELSKAVSWALRAHPARSLSLVLSLGAGIAAAVFVSTIISGFGREIDRLAFGTYASALVVRENLFVKDRYGPPRLSESEVLAQELTDIEAVAGWSTGRSATVSGSESISFEIFGVWGRYEDELDTPFVSGRYITRDEALTGARVCLLGADLAAKLERLGVDDDLSVNGINCRVVGILGEPNSRPAARYLGAVIAPLGAVERYFSRRDDRVPGSVDRITLFFPANTDMLDAEMRTDLALRRVRGVPLTRPSPFIYGDPSTTLKQQRDQQAMLNRLLIVVAALSVIASLVGFAAISAAAIASRRRELALRLAVGATEVDLQIQILTETIVAGAIASLGGLAVGLGVAYGASRFWSWPFAPNLGVAGVAIGLGIVVGAVTGWLLARRLATLSPSIAAR